MPWKQCEYIQPTGKECQAPAMRGTSFCHHHRRRKLKPAAAYIPQDLTDSRQVAIALGNIMRAILTNRISSEEGGRLIYGMQIAVTENSKRLKDMTRRRTNNQEPKVRSTASD